jgi:uncharacterized RDD family membrane protein YckC
MTDTPEAPREPEQAQTEPEPAPQSPFAPGSYGQPHDAQEQQAQSPYQQQPHQEQQQHSPYQQPPPPPPPPGPGPGQYGQTPYDQPAYGQQPPPQYGQSPYGQSQYGQQSQYGYGYGQQQPYGAPGATLPIGMPPFAGWWDRVAAFLLDNGIAIIGGSFDSANINSGANVAFGIVSLIGLVWAIYNAVQAGRTGQSFGKRTVGIRLARFTDGMPVGGGLGFLRLFFNWLFSVLCFIPGLLNYLWPLWDAKHQTWSDKIARSVVVKA